MAEGARKLNDFASMVPISMALNSAYIKSLKRVWQFFPSMRHILLLQELSKYAEKGKGVKEGVKV